MHARIVRGAVRSAAVAAAVTGTLTWAPAATAQPSEPTPSAPAPAMTPAPDAGSIAITKKDAAGDVLPGAAFLLLDATGQEAARGKTDAQGKLTFPDLAPGVYRLKETASGSPLHDVVADQDVIVTPGATAQLMITDPFKAAQVLLKAKDDKTGKLLPGSTVNIGTGSETLLTLTTGAQGTATGELPVTSRKTDFWVKQVKAPQGYDLYKPAKTVTAGPGAPVTVTTTNAKTATTPKPDPSEKPPPKPDPSGKPTDKPTPTPAPSDKPTDEPTDSPSGGTRPSPTPTPADSATPDADPSPVPPAVATAEAMPKAPDGSLAHTGADATPWILGAGGLLVAVGSGALIAVRRRKTAEPEQDTNGEIS